MYSLPEGRLLTYDRIAAVVLSVALMVAAHRLDFDDKGGPLGFVVLGLLLIFLGPRHPAGLDEEVTAPVAAFLGWFVLVVAGGGAVASKAVGALG